MKLSYDPEVDALRIVFRETTVTTQLCLSGCLPKQPSPSRPHARAMYKPCPSHAQAMPKPCTSHAQAMHKPCTSHAQA